SDLYQVTSGGHTEAQSAGPHVQHVRVGAGERLVTGVAVATTTLGALERGGEGPGGLLPARAGWPGEQPGMCHPGASATGNEVGEIGAGTPQLFGRALLTHEAVEDRPP